jgi:hypothetical protein
MASEWSTTQTMYSTIVIASVALGVGKHKQAILKSDLSLSSTISRQKRHKNEKTATKMQSIPITQSFLVTVMSTYP